MYAFLRRPAWILSHVLVALLVASLVGLGFWQRARWLDEKDKKERLEQKADSAPVPFDDVVPPGTQIDDVDEPLRYTRVVLTGTYDVASEVAILNRSQAGAPGAWVLTPLVTEDGRAVPVVRGWIRYDPSGVDPPFADALPPEGEVTVTGNLQLTQRRGSVGAVDPDDGVLDALSRVDLERFAQQLEHDLAPAWVLLDGQDPPQPDAYPSLVELQTQDPSQNFSYMVQWWIFAAIAAGGYPLVLRAVARTRIKGDLMPRDTEDGDSDDRGPADRDPEPGPPGTGVGTSVADVPAAPR
jgi:cytochrome oxidase assembly protein ShyY1